MRRPAAAPLPGPVAVPLPGYQVIEVTLAADSPAVGRALGSIGWPPGCIPVSVLRQRKLADPDPALTLAPGDRISLLAPVAARQPV